MKKLLIIRFSSFGDIVHTKALLKPLKKEWPNCQVSWLVRKDLRGTLEGDEYIDRIITFDRKLGLKGLIKMAWDLRGQFDFIYDAHNNTRSTIFRLINLPFTRGTSIVRSKERWKRFLLFKLGINKFPQPYKAMESYWNPLKKALGLQGELSPYPWPIKPSQELSDQLKDRVVLVPAAAWAMKTWPLDHFKRLVELLPDKKFLILGGPEDDFCEEIVTVAPDRVLNMAGKLSLSQSCAVVGYCDFVVTADTGLQQVADLAGVKGLSLMGPTAFGFTTMGTLKTMEVDLPCRPCSKDGSGDCKRQIYQECLIKISPEAVASEIKKLMP